MAVRLLLMLVLSSAPGVAWAQGAPQSGADDVRARRLFEQASAALLVGRFAEAAEQLRESLELTPRASTAFNLAVALRGMGDAIGAVTILEVLTEGAYGPLDAERRKQARALLEAARRDVGTLVVSLERSPRATLRLDGEPVGHVEPDEPFERRVNPGRRIVQLSAEGRATVERAVEVERGRAATLTVELPPDRRPGVLILETAEPHNVVEIVGVAKAHGRLVRELEPGEYEVRVRGHGGVRESRVTVPAAGRIRLVLETPERSPARHPGLWLTVGAVVIGGAAAAGVLLSRRERDPVVDPLWGVTEALEVRFP